MKQRLETATAATAKLVSRNGAESAAELLNAPELLTANDAAFRAPIKGDISLPECDGVRTQVQGLPELPVAVGQPASNAALGAGWVLRSDTGGIRYS